MYLGKLSAASLAALTLAACGGSGGDGEDPIQGVDFEISNGVLADFEVPTADQIADLPSPIADTVNGFIEANENETLTPTLPGGKILFVGPWAMGETDDGDALAGGTMSLDADFDDALLNGRLDVEYVFDDDGNALPVTRNPLEEFDVDINGVVQDNAIVADLNGRFDVDGETVSVGGLVRGEFTGDGATGAIGTLEVSAQYGDGSDGGFDGIFQLDAQAQN